MMNTEVVERIQQINSEIYRFFESEIMWESMDEYLSSEEMVILMDKLEERYGFASEVEKAMGSTDQVDNVRRYFWVGTQRIEISGYKTLRFMSDVIIATIAEEVEVVTREYYYKQLVQDYMEGACLDERLSTFIGMLSAVSMDRFCDEAFAEVLRNACFSVGKANYCGCADRYYVEDRIGNRIWFDDVIVKNGDNPVWKHRPRIEVLQTLLKKI